MRNTIKTIAALLIVLSAAKSNASVDTTYVETYCKVVAQEKEDQFKLIYKSLEEEPVSIQWVDAKNQIVYIDKIKSTDAFVKQYDLTTLPDGSYKVIVKSEDFTFEEEIVLGDLSDLKINLRAIDEKSVLMTGFKPAKKNVKLSIYDDNQNRIYSELYDEGTIIQKKYNFKNVKSTSIKFVLEHRGDVIVDETFAL